MLTEDVQALEVEHRRELLNGIQTASTFNKNNDPYREHDFGAIEVSGARYFWKIDYYNLSLDSGSEDPSDPSKTARVMTIMHASEY